MLSRRLFVRSYSSLRAGGHEGIPLSSTGASLGVAAGGVATTPRKSWKSRQSTTTANAQKLTPERVSAKRSLEDQAVVKKWQNTVDQIQNETESKRTGPKRVTIFHLRKYYGTKFVVWYMSVYCAGAVTFFYLFHTRTFNKDAFFDWALPTSYNETLREDWDVPVSLALAFTFNEILEVLRFPFLLALRGTVQKYR